MNQALLILLQNTVHIVDSPPQPTLKKKPT